MYVLSAGGAIILYCGALTCTRVNGASSAVPPARASAGALLFSTCRRAALGNAPRHQPPLERGPSGLICGWQGHDGVVDGR